MVTKGIRLVVCLSKVYFSLNAVGAPKSNVGMGGYPLVSEKCTHVTLYILYYFCIQEIHGLVRFFMV